MNAMKKWLVGVVGVGMLSLASTSFAAPMVDDLNGGTDAGANYVDGQFVNNVLPASDFGFGQFSTSEIIGGAASLINDLPVSPYRQGRMAWGSTASAWAGDYSTKASASVDLSLSIGADGGYATVIPFFISGNGDLWESQDSLTKGDWLSSGTYNGSIPYVYSGTYNVDLATSFSSGNWVWQQNYQFGSDDMNYFMADLRNVQSFGFLVMTAAPVSQYPDYSFDYLTLDNFTLNDAPAPLGVPEPETVWMMLAVVASLGVTFRRQLTSLVTRA